MYYDGWESCAIDMDTGKCAEDGPGKWATQFWYERDDLCSDHDVEANKPISSYVFRPRVGSEGVSLERSEYTREMEQRLSTKKMKAKLLR